MSRISKSDYVLGLKCPNALWFKKFKPEIEQHKNTTVLERGTAVGELACEKFPGGVQITAKPWEAAALTQTQNAIENNSAYIYEATFSTQNDEYCAVDILANNNDGTWDIIEVKSTKTPHEYHFLDISFQKYVLEQCGIKVKNCFILTLDSEYVRHGPLDVKALFKLNDANDKLQDFETVRQNVARIKSILAGPELGIAVSKTKCNMFYECPYKHYCWSNIPDYSVFNAFRASVADQLYSLYGADLENIPPELYTKQLHSGDIEAFLTNTEIIDKTILNDFIKQLTWPLYFLDYESFMPAVPMFDNSHPYQQICFQFSLHVQRVPNGELEHYEYLHNDASCDPRPGLIRQLVKSIGQTGSVIVYNKSFEVPRNNEMARDFPEYATQLSAINERVVDLLEPFRCRGLYRPCQNGSASIKHTLPTFVPDMSYSELGIQNGDQASQQFFEFMQGKYSAHQAEQMLKNLHEYCSQDTMAMVKLLEIVQTFAKK